MIATVLAFTAIIILLLCVVSIFTDAPKSVSILLLCGSLMFLLASFFAYSMEQTEPVEKQYIVTYKMVDNKLIPADTIVSPF